MSKDEVAAALDEIGTLLELQGESSFRTNAYHNGARVVQQLEGDLKQLVTEKQLGEVRGIGATLQEKITTLVTTGRLQYLEDLRASIPRDWCRCSACRYRAEESEGGLRHPEDRHHRRPESGLRARRVAKLKGFGANPGEDPRRIAFLGQVGNRVRIDLALPLGLALLEQIKKMPGVIRAELCGSLRRRRETAKDIDILASSKNAAPIMDAFVALPEVVQVVGHGPTKSSIVAEMHTQGEKVTLNADLRVVEDKEFPFGLMYFTGSKEHNIRLRQRAIDQGLSLNEYALANEKKSVPAKSEADIYKALGLEYIPPEMREDTGEIAVAEAKKIPALVEVGDIRGVFHNHTTYSDGTASLEEMALAAKKLGFEYFGVGDHSQSLTIARGLPPGAVRKQWAEIDKVNAKLSGVTIIKGTEVDILEDGSLDYDDELLGGFDYVVASVHTLFNMSEADMTARVCKALAHPAVTMLGHSTGRLLLRRDGYRINLEDVLKAAAKHGKMIEINAQPLRLDLDWVHVKRAKAMGIPIVINPDAHSPGELALFSCGVDVARRGWLTKDDIFNTRGFKDVMKELKKRKRV